MSAENDVDHRLSLQMPLTDEDYSAAVKGLFLDPTPEELALTSDILDLQLSEGLATNLAHTRDPAEAIDAMVCAARLYLAKAEQLRSRFASPVH